MNNRTPKISAAPPPADDVVDAIIIHLRHGPRSVMELVKLTGFKRTRTQDALQYLEIYNRVEHYMVGVMKKWCLRGQAPATCQLQDRNYDVKETIINGDPSHRRVQFGNRHKSGKGLQPARRGQGWTPLASPYLLD